MTRTNTNTFQRWAIIWIASAILALVAVPLMAEQVGEVDTAFKFVGPNHKIVIEVFDDPKISGVSCYLSRAKTGGLTGMVGLAEDTSDASIACRQVGAIKIAEAFEAGEEVFQVDMSILFKEMHVVRHYDGKRKVLTYLVYSDRLINGSPKNSISVVPITPWGGVDADLTAIPDE